jgi:hypothetical protein
VVPRQGIAGPCARRPSGPAATAPHDPARPRRRWPTTQSHSGAPTFVSSHSNRHPHALPGPASCHATLAVSVPLMAVVVLPASWLLVTPFTPVAWWLAVVARAAGGGAGVVGDSGGRLCSAPTGRRTHRVGAARGGGGLDDLRSAGAGYPDLPVVSPAIQVAAPLVLRDKGHQGVQHIRHTPSRTLPLSASPQQGSAGRRV